MHFHLRIFTGEYIQLGFHTIKSIIQSLRESSHSSEARCKKKNYHGNNMQKTVIKPRRNATASQQ